MSSKIVNKIDGECKGCYVGKRGKEKETTHTITGTFYKCEDCRSFYCHRCIMYDEDEWEERTNDEVFMCWNCYRMCQIIADIG